MTELRALLEQRGIRRAVVIDDVYDAVPRPDEMPAENWSVFFDDLRDEDERLLAEIFPDYEGTRREDLQHSEKFISALWENRGKLVEKCCPLFSEYENTNATERMRLDELVRALGELGLTCTTMGRLLSEDANQADLVFVDLFLGFTQSDGDMADAIERVKSLVGERVERPPLVVLMSRSGRLWDKRNEFRDQASLLGSTFRVISKADLAKDGMLATLLTRLASHYEDAKRVAGFVYAWDQGLNSARERFIKILRRLDLADLAQVQTLLLDFEGQKPGEYLLDISDRVLQHEIEADAPTIAAAKELSKIDLSKYPAPHLDGSPDLQDLAHRMIFQHRERLKLSEDWEHVQVQFGDVFRLVDRDNGAAVPIRVCLVVTPACDLARCSTDANVLLLPGDLKPLTVADWSYRSGAVRTPVFTADDGTRSWIRWDLKDRYTWTLGALLQKLRDGDIERIGRIREMYAVEIQQRLLADMGRIGQPANPPATFPVAVSVFQVCEGEGGAAIARTLAIPRLDAAVCFVGRDEESKRVDRLVLSEAACDALRNAAIDLADNIVCQWARPSLMAMRTDTEFFTRFERGLIHLPQSANKFKEEKGSGGNLIYLRIVRNGAIKDGDAITGSQRNGPFIIKIIDISGTDA